MLMTVAASKMYVGSRAALGEKGSYGLVRNEDEFGNRYLITCRLSALALERKKHGSHSFRLRKGQPGREFACVPGALHLRRAEPYTEPETLQSPGEDIETAPASGL